MAASSDTADRKPKMPAEGKNISSTARPVPSTSNKMAQTQGSMEWQWLVVSGHGSTASRCTACRGNPHCRGVDSTRTITNVRIVTCSDSCKIPPRVETNLMAMTMPNPRPEPEAGAGAASIDWPSVLAEHERWLRTVICARVGEPQAIDEVMQEVSLAAVRQQAPLSDPAKVGPWLYRLAVRQSLLYRRKQGRRRKLIDRYAQRYRPSEADNRAGRPAGLVVGRGAPGAGSRGDVAAAEARRGDLMLKYTEDWSYRALAEHLGVSESAVETRLHRARQRLRTELAALNVTPADAVTSHDCHEHEHATTLPLDDSRFDRLVDGELSEEERRELLAGLDAEPGGWRRCALAFLESQCWKAGARRVLDGRGCH